MVWESILFMYLMSLGVFQLIASWADLSGMSFFFKKSFGYAFGVVTVIFAFCWFFTTVEFSEGGPKGQHDDQFISFTLGLFGALLTTWVVASIIKIGQFDQSEGSGDIDAGIEIFREETFFQVLRRNLRALLGWEDNAS